MEKVTGIGGVFFKAKDPKALAAWYEKHLGLAFGGQAYMSFTWKGNEQTTFSFFKQDSAYFSPSESPFMINFRVKDLDALLAELRAAGVWVDEKTDSADYGKFGWIMDPEGNKIELWEPVDEKL